MSRWMVGTKESVYKLRKNVLILGNGETFAELCHLYLLIEVNLNGSNIDHVTDFKLLGVALDQGLSFNRQVQE